MASQDLQELPAPHDQLARYIADHPDIPVTQIMEPYRKYEAQLRSIFAQDRKNALLEDPHVNVLPLFTKDTKDIKIRARDLASESQEEKDRYIMPLPEDKRRADGSPAVVGSLAEFRRNFSIFSESSLADLDWSNIVAAGSSVVNTLLPVPQEFNGTKRKLREYYHEKFCPASDVDLFLYGLTHDEAVEKIKQVEKAIRDAILTEVTVVRTKYAITIASQYPTRHVQIVLRVYKSIGEILTGFDIDAAGGAYDGSQVWVTPRALGSFITQINHIDLTRRSPSYENRLSKYSHRNFEVYWPELDRSRVDPTIFERSFQRTLGLARLLVLERLPTSSVRDTYLNKRREERGRPAINRFRHRLFGNIKDMHEDEVADWVDESEVSNYHTFTVPYGQKFHAKKIEKLCYTRDLLLNAEWNQPKEREVYLHRHPAFFGRVEDVIEDCCGFCPQAVTPEEIEVAEKEKEIYISGKVSFMIDDPGRQQIGSFNPLTEDDWTDMAYVGNTARLCQSIVDCNLEEVNSWLSQDNADPDKRDYTGRTPLQLAVISSTPEIVKTLIEHGARLTARLADGMTALHLAAERGNVEMIKLLMEKSIENEAEEEEKEDRRRKAQREAAKDSDAAAGKDEETDEDDEDDEDADEDESDGELIDGEETDVDVHSIATGSFVKVKKEDEEGQDAAELDGGKDEPDFYKSDVLAWDIPCSPLHLAIAQGHEDVVTELCNYGSDSLLPVKFLNSEKKPTGAILTLALALVLPLEKAKSMAKLLLKLGATSSQADLHGCTALHRYIQNGTDEMVDLLWSEDKSGVKTAINHLVVPENSYYNAKAVGPLHTAIDKGDIALVLRLLEVGAKPEIDFDSWLKATKFSSRSTRLGDFEANKKLFGRSIEQPLIYAALNCVDPAVALEILERGADPNAITARSSELLTDEWSRRYNKGESVLDVVQTQIKRLRKFKGERTNRPRKGTQLPKNMHEVLSTLPQDSYQHYFAKADITSRERTYKAEQESQEHAEAQIESLSLEDKKAAIEEAIAGLKQLEEALIAAGAKSFYDIHPTIKKPERYYNDSSDDSTEDQAKEEATPPYELKIIFRSVNDVTETRKEAYVKLFEAAWAGDLETINSLALSPWGKDKEEPPLKIAVSDSNANTPFSLAFFRGHHDVAKAVLEIVKAQYSPTDKEDERYKLDTGYNDELDLDEDESYNSEDDGSDDSDPKIVSEVINKKFTIDNIGQVSMQVKSHTRPLDFMLWQSPSLRPLEEGEISTIAGVFRQTMKQDDQPSFNRLMDWAVDYAGQELQGDARDDEHYFVFPEADFKYAVENGKVSFLAEIIKRTGAGMPLDTLVKKSGVEIKEKPKTYQGLTVYGKKRKDWATAGRNLVVKSTGLKTPPLLHAAFAGNIESVEWFLGDTPHRYYVEFGKSEANANDPRLKHLNQTAGVFDRAVSNWLGIQNELIIHCAVLGKPGKKTEKLLEYLVESCPASLEYKCKTGDTPLQLAFWSGRLGFAKILLAAGANQSVRNAEGRNIIHSLLQRTPKADRLKPMLELIDPGLRSHLLVQRNNLHEEGVTPLHAWVKSYCESQDERDRAPKQPPAGTKHYKYCCYKNKEEGLAVLHLLLEYSQGAELEMLNGAGDTPLHTATMQHNLDLIEALLTYKSQLLYRENAVGRTPIEVARSRVLSRKFETPQAVTQTGWYSNDSMGQTLVDRKPEDYAEDKKLVEEQGINPWPRRAQQERFRGYNGERNHKNAKKMEKALEIMEEFLIKHPGERRLVSLGEANDVARRLSEKYNASRYFSIQPRPDDDEEKDEDDDEKKDQADFVGILRNQGTVHPPWQPRIETVNGKEVEEY